MPQMNTQSTDDLHKTNADSTGSMNAKERTSNAVNTLKEKASDQYDHVQDYLRQTDVKSAAKDIQVFAQRHPLKAAAIGIGIGYMIGRLMRR